MKLSMITAASVIEAQILANVPVMLWGPPGVGKSSLFRQIAKKLSTPKEEWGHIDFRAALRDPVDLRGLPLVDANKGTTRWLPPNELPQEKRDGKRGLLVLDELPQSMMAMQNACFSLVLDRYIGEYHLPPGWVVVAAGNRRSDRSGAGAMNKALANRFAHFEVAPELDAWRKWAAEHDIHPMVVAFVCFRTQFLHAMPDDADENAYPTPRAWEQVSKHMGVTNADLRHALVASLVGENVANEFEAFISVFSHLPSIDAILRDPKTVRLPDLTEPGIMFALAMGLARRATKKDFGNALTYMERVNSPEHITMFAVDAARRDPKLKETPAFAKWYVDNQDVVL